MNQEILPNLTSPLHQIVLGGVYEHYKKLLYRVMAVGRHSESLEEVVVYQALYGEKGIWVRPLKMFLEDVEKEGTLLPRFRLLDDCSE